jgi:hypothetical protein
MWGRFRQLRRAIIVVLVAALASVGTAATAQAFNSPSWWAPASVPLVASGYGSKAWAAGTARMTYTSGGTRLYNTGQYKFHNGDNHRPYLVGSSEWNAGYCRNYSATVAYKGVAVASSSACQRAFYDGQDFSRVDGVGSTTAKWTTFSVRTAAPNAGSDRGRARVRVCIDIPLRSDVCSGTAYSQADSF